MGFFKWKTYRRPRLSPAENVHPGHGPVDFAETPRSLFLPRLFVICLGLVILIEDIICVELEERLDLCHHPGQRNVGLALIRIPSSNVLMYTGEPVLSAGVSPVNLDPGGAVTYLSEVGRVIARLRPYTRLQITLVIHRLIDWILGILR